MRPVERGDRPRDDQGAEITFESYQQARKALIKRLGEYCSYCEVHLDASLAVEHIRPKKPPGAATTLRDRELDWGNFLLACTNCNSIKGNTDVILGEYLWPDRDDTFAALSYQLGGIVKAAPGRGRIKANRLIKLVGLQRQVDTAEASDRRWQNRREAWDLAVLSKDNLAQSPTDHMRNIIIELAKAKGFWSVWMTVFADDSTMCERLLAAYPGTRNKYFVTGP